MGSEDQFRQSIWDAYYSWKNGVDDDSQFQKRVEAAFEILEHAKEHQAVVDWMRWQCLG